MYGTVYGMQYIQRITRNAKPFRIGSTKCRYSRYVHAYKNVTAIIKGGFQITPTQMVCM